MKQIPNIFTLLNLLFGCIAIVMIVQPGLTITSDETGASFVIIPEKIFLGSVFIGLAAIVDFFDGFVARWMKATSEIGKQLDSLADVVSFGVAPGMIVFQFLRLSYAQQEDGLDISLIWLIPAFVIPCAGAYRLARFNVAPPSTKGFTGVPIPAAGLLIASFPLIYWFSTSPFVIDLFHNKWWWYFVIAVTSWLMVSNLPMLALKFSSINAKTLMPFIILAVIIAVTAILWGWIAVPISFLSYVILSIIFKPESDAL